MVPILHLFDLFTIYLLQICYQRYNAIREGRRNAIRFIFLSLFLFVSTCHLVGRRGGEGFSRLVGKGGQKWSGNEERGSDRVSGEKEEEEVGDGGG